MPREPTCTPGDISRRTILSGAVSCGAYTLFALGATTALNRRAFADQALGETVRTEPFARLEMLGQGVWAMISTTGPGQMQTVSNGGIIAGSEGVLVVEGLNTIEGAAWLSQMAKDLTGRWPTHVVVTHYHGDHSNGLAGHLRGAEPPAVLATLKTRELLLNQWGQPPAGEGDQVIATTGQPRLVPNAILVHPDRTTTIDLGGRTVRLVPRLGHTPSDLTIELDEPKLTWCGDLFFNRLFPWYGDAIPSKLSATCTALFEDIHTTYIPGHGPIAKREDVRNYLGMIEHVGQAAHTAFDAGKTADQAWREYQIPEALGEWAKFREDVYRYAFLAWERELRGE